MALAPVLAFDYRVLSIRRVVDGDTFDLVLDLGFYLTTALRFRLLGVDAPELSAPAGPVARDYASAWLFSRLPTLRVRTEKTDSFGRWLADPYSGEERLADALLAADLAVPFRR